MSDEVLYDNRNNRLGFIKTESGGRQVAYDTKNNRLGHYDPKANQTYDTRNNRLGTGNMLSALVMRTQR